MCTNQPGFVGISIRGHKMEGKVGTLGLRKDPSVRVGCSGEQCVWGGFWAHIQGNGLHRTSLR